MDGWMDGWVGGWMDVSFTNLSFINGFPMDGWMDVSFTKSQSLMGFQWMDGCFIHKV
jgi:hypothetical protein